MTRKMFLNIIFLLLWSYTLFFVQGERESTRVHVYWPASHCFIHLQMHFTILLSSSVQPAFVYCVLTFTLSCQFSLHYLRDCNCLEKVLSSQQNSKFYLIKIPLPIFLGKFYIAMWIYSPSNLSTSVGKRNIPNWTAM